MATTTKKSSVSKKTKTSAAKSTKKITKVPTKVSAKLAVKKTGTALTLTQKLFRINIAFATAQAIQAGLILWLAKPDAGLQTVTTNHLTNDTLASTAEVPVVVAATRSLFDVNLAWLVAAIFIISAIVHVLIATKYRKRFEADLAKETNKARWIEQGLVYGTTMLVVALLVGIFDISALIMVFSLTAIMHMCGLVMEHVKDKRGMVSKTLLYISVKAGLVPWAVLAIYLIGSSKYSDGASTPAYVYYVVASMFVLVGGFAVNMYLQKEKRGKWADYMYGEKVYMVLGFVSSAALAWQVYAGALRG